MSFVKLDFSMWKSYMVLAIQGANTKGQANLRLAAHYKEFIRKR
jgi:hypothetical protein